MSADIETVRRWARHGVRLGWVNPYGAETTATAFALVDGDGYFVPNAKGDLTGCYLRVRVGGGGFMDIPVDEAEARFTESTVVGGL